MHGPSFVKAKLGTMLGRKLRGVDHDSPPHVIVRVPIHYDVLLRNDHFRDPARKLYLLEDVSLQQELEPEMQLARWTKRRVRNLNTFVILSQASAKAGDPAKKWPRARYCV